MLLYSTPSCALSWRAWRMICTRVDKAAQGLSLSTQEADNATKTLEIQLENALEEENAIELEIRRRLRVLGDGPWACVAKGSALS